MNHQQKGTNMNRHPRNASLLAQLAETNQFRPLAERAFDIENDFEKAMEAVGLDRNLSPQGKKEKAQGHLHKALHDLVNLQKPVDEYRKQTASLRSEMKTPTFDKADDYAARLRRELRDRSCTMTPGQRAGLMTGPNRSVEFIDALLEQPGWVSGINIHEKGEREIFESAKEERLRDLNGPLVTALEARASVESEIAMVIDIVRNDLENDAAQLASRAA